MKLHINKIAEVVKRYYAAEVLPKAPNATSQFFLGFMTPYISNYVNSMISEKKEMAKSLGIVDDGDRIDLDMAYQSAVESIDKAGGKVPAFGLIFDRSDVDKLAEIARSMAV